MNREMIINRPLANTYRWLHVNGTETFIPPEFVPFPGAVLQGPDLTGGAGSIRTGMGPDMDSIAAGFQVSSFASDAGSMGVLRLNYPLDETEKPVARGAAIHLCAREGSNLTVVADLHGAGEKCAAAALQTKAVVEKNAVLRLVVVQRAGRNHAVYNNVGVRCEDNARFEYVRLILGGTMTLDGCSVALEGDGSSFAADIGYRMDGKSKLDMNYESIHMGKKTDCAIHAAGVLRDKADKLFRGTIDFRQGCSGSTGAETEDVLLMNETVRNRTVPVILCSEEDVDGSHGATIGRLDEGLVYYLQSRGLTEEAVYELCAQAKLDAVIRKIPDPETVRRLFPRLAEEGAET